MEPYTPEGYTIPKYHDLEFMVGKLVRVHCIHGYTNGVLLTVNERGITLDTMSRQAQLKEHVEVGGDIVGWAKLYTIPWAAIRVITWETTRRVN